MRVEYVQPFIEAAYSTISEFLGEEQVIRGELYFKRRELQNVMGLVAVIGLTGQAEGRVLLDMEEATALNIATAIHGEHPSDEMVQATIQEIANVLAGRAITKLYELGFIFDITPPAIFVGKQLRPSSQEVLVLPLGTKLGDVDVHISIFDKLQENL